MVFKTIQNKMHWASHGETAAETIYRRVNSKKEHIGLTSFKGEIPTKKETPFPMNEYHEYAPKVHQSSFHRPLLLAGHRSWQSLLSDTL
jgi:hypothetical protein